MRFNRNYRNPNQPMTDEEIQEVAPSAFAGQAYERQSDRYAFVPTSAVISGMRNAGFAVVKALQSRSNISGKSMFTKHLISFQPLNLTAQNQIGDVTVRVNLTNSHDGTSCYVLDMGAFRFACLNGLWVSEGFVDSFKIRHTGNIIEQVIAASTRIIEQAPKVVEAISEWKTIQLSPAEQNILAEAAHSLRFPVDETGNSNTDIKPVDLLTPRRSADSGNDLWTSYNRVQENVVAGGIRTRSASGRRMRTREVKGISETSSLNKALWAMAAKMADLKKS